jgi:hypothetical protein
MGYRSVLAPALVLAAAVALAALASRPDAYRALFAALIALNLIVVAFVRPRTAILLTLAFLPFLGFVRRLLIIPAGWSLNDPLSLVGPFVAAALCINLFTVRRRPVAPDALSKTFLVLLGVVLLQTVNTSAAPLSENVSWLLAAAVPLLWYFAGRGLADRETVHGVIRILVVTATAVALYGAWQTTVGFPSWDTAWLRANGYPSLQVTADVTRAFSTFASSAEFGVYMGLALVACIAMAVHGRLAYLVPVPLLTVELFLLSSRGLLVVSLAVAVCVAAMRTGSGKTALVVSLLVFGIAAGAVATSGQQLARAGEQSGNALVSHQVGGLVNPTDPKASTLGLHVNLIVDGFSDGIRRPLGQGMGVLSLRNTENGFMNILLQTGILGFVLLVLAAFFAIARTARNYLRRPDPVALAAFGLTLGTVGEWLNGRYYAAAPLVMVVIGWATWRGREPHEAEDEATQAGARPESWTRASKVRSSPSSVRATL